MLFRDESGFKTGRLVFRPPFPNPNLLSLHLALPVHRGININDRTIAYEIHKMTRLRILDEPIETWTNYEREIRMYRDRFHIRSLRPEEYRVYGQNELYVPPMGFERL